MQRATGETVKLYTVTFHCPHCGQVHDVVGGGPGLGLAIPHGPDRAGTVTQLWPSGNYPPSVASLWQEVMGESWDESKGATDPVQRQALRDELDALVAHLYRLTRDDFQHILGTFPLVFPDNEAGHTRKEALLTTYDHFAAQVKDWSRE
jgi:hypothetical protein